MYVIDFEQNNRGEKRGSYQLTTYLVPWLYQALYIASYIQNVSQLFEVASYCLTQQYVTSTNMVLKAATKDILVECIMDDIATHMGSKNYVNVANALINYVTSQLASCVVHKIFTEQEVAIASQMVLFAI